MQIFAWSAVISHELPILQLQSTAYGPTTWIDDMGRGHDRAHVDVQYMLYLFVYCRSSPTDDVTMLSMHSGSLRGT